MSGSNDKVYTLFEHSRGSRAESGDPSETRLGGSGDPRPEKHDVDRHTAPPPPSYTSYPDPKPEPEPEPEPRVQITNHHGDTIIVRSNESTIITRPSRIVIRDFQNTYMRGDGSAEDEINTQLKQLVELSLSSRDLPNDEKEEVVQAIHAIAEQVRDDKVNRLTFKGALEAVKAIVVKASDIAGPAVAIIAAVLKLAGIG